MAAARTLARRRMGACETTPPATHREHSTRPLISQPQTTPSSPSRISRRLPASSSFVLAAARLRALQLDPWPRGGKTRAAARKIQKNSQPSPAAARSHRVRSVRPLDTGGPYGCRGQGLPDRHGAGTSVRTCTPDGVRHPDGEADRRSRRKGRAAGTQARTIQLPQAPSDLDPGRRQAPALDHRRAPHPGSRPST